MCGISGELRFDGQPARRDVVASMTDQMASRGPDGTGLWSSDGVAVGHRRLSIIDLSERGAQPMVDPELGLVIVFNGCIYNYRQLRQELEAAGYRFFSTSDTEVILKAYHRWGEAFVERLAGMFAFCIIERESGRAVLGRDRLGIKPLYLADDPSGRALRFASTLPALVSVGGVDCSIDPVALHHYLTFHAVVPAPRTIIKGVTKLPPATLLTVERDGRRREVRYWHPTHDPEAKRPDSDREWREAVAETLRVAVDRRMVADVPVGVLLSGGLDSSLIVGLLRERGQDDLSTFSIGFETIGDEEGDEFRWSDMVADHFETDHHRFRVPTERVLSALEPTVQAMSEPMVSHDVVAFFLLSQEVSRHLKVVQSGQGADEVFAGYHWYEKLAAAEGATDGVDDYAGVFFDRTHADIAGVVNPDYLAGTDVSRDFVTRHFAEAGAATTVDRALRIDTHVMLVEDPVKRVDNTSMAWGLEARVPFLDHELVELAAACPTALKLAGGGKGILKDIARDVLPHEVIDRPKGYFPVPPLIYLQGPYVDLLRDALTSSAARERGLFRPEHVRHLIDNPNELTTLRYNQLWEVGLLELWLQIHDIL